MCFSSAFGSALSSRIPFSRRDASRVARRTVGLATIVCAALAVVVGLARAEDSGDPFVGAEQMIVLGAEAANPLQKQEVSAIAFSAEHLEAIGANDLTDVATFTPNLEIRTPFAASNPTLFIRGVGLRDFNANSSSSVAVYNDDIYMNSPAGQLAQLFDVENIDVLRGPQTTMYARNASAGAIRVIARKPTGETGMTGSVTYGRFNQLDFQAAFENVIVPDRITMRTSAKWSQREGLTKNRCADSSYHDLPPQTSNNGSDPLQALRFSVFEFCFNEPNVEPTVSPPQNGWIRNGNQAEKPPVKEWVNDRKNWAARSIIRFQHEFLDMEWLLNIHGGQNRGDARQFQNFATRLLTGRQRPVTARLDQGSYLDPDQRLWVNRNRFRLTGDPFGGNPFEGDYNRVEKEKIDLLGANITGRLALADGKYVLTSITGYEFNDRDTTVDLDASPGVGLEPRLTNTAYQLTQEIRLEFNDGGTLRWQLAGMFLYEALEADNTFSTNVLVGEVRQFYSFFTRYAAGWARLEWEPAETFSIKGGVRLNYEEKELDLGAQQFKIIGGSGRRVPRKCPILNCPVPGVNPGEDLPPRYARGAAKEYGWAGDVIATWSPATDVSIYLRYARGWKGPHINAGITSPGVEGTPRGELSSPVEPEKIDSVELGMKSEFWANRIRVNWAMFHYDYQDIQVFQLRNVGGVPLQQLLNGDDADVFGIEAEIDVRPFDGWAHPLLQGLWARVTFAWLDTKYTDFVFSVPEWVGEPPVRVIVTEDFTGNQLVNAPEFSFIGFVAWPFGGEWGTVIPRVDWSYKDKVYFGVTNAGLASQDSLWLANARVTYKSPSEAFEVAAWVANLTDQAYTLDAFDLTRVRGAILHAIGDPRTWGVTMKMNF